MDWVLTFLRFRYPGATNWVKEPLTTELPVDDTQVSLSQKTDNERQASLKILRAVRPPVVNAFRIM